MRIFHSTFTMQIQNPENIRLKGDMGGGTLYDIGIYCLNAARSLFKAEPTEVMAMSANNGEARFSEIDEMTSVLMRFPNEQMAVFTASFGAAETGKYEIIGTKGTIEVQNAYSFTDGMKQTLKVGGKTKRFKYSERDQFAPELIYFSECIQKGRDPEPSGEEGLADVRVIEALLSSAKTGKLVKLEAKKELRHPRFSKGIHRKAISPKPETIKVIRH